VGVAYNQGRAPKTAITATNREPRTQPKMLARLGKLFGIVSSSELMSFGWMCVCDCVGVCVHVRVIVGVRASVWVCADWLAFITQPGPAA